MGGGAVAAAKMALGQPYAITRVTIAQTGVFEPGNRFTEIRDAGIEEACLDFPIAAHPFRHWDVVRQGLERQRFLAILHSPLRIAPINVHCSRAPQTDHLDPKVLQSGAVVEGTAAIIQACSPVAEGKRRRLQMPDRATGPPEIAESLEAGERPFAHFNRVPQLAGEQIDLRLTGLGKSLDLVQTGGGGKFRRIIAMIDRDIRPPPGQDVQEAPPVMPGGAAAWIALVDETAYLIEGLDVFGMLPESKFDLGLFDDRVDAAQPVRFLIGQEVETEERIVEKGQRLAVGPKSLRFFGREDRIVDGFLSLIAAAEVKRQQFSDFVGAAAIELLERLSDGSMIGAAMPFE